MAAARQSADASVLSMCQIVRMWWNTARFVAAFAGLVIASAEASAQRNAVESWDPSARDFGRSMIEPGAPGDARNSTLDALNKILSSAKLSAFDRSIYLSIRAYQLTRLGRDADSQKDIAEMGKVLPTAWPVVLSGTVPELAGGGDRAAALRTLDSALASATSPADRRTALYYRGHANFNLGRYPEAADDFGASLEGRNTLRSRLGPLLWHYAAQVHSRRDARGTLAKALASEPLDEWPLPIAKFLLGKLGAGELEVLAESGEAAKRANGKCPTALFVGVDALRRGDKQRAREQFQLAQARCPTVSEFNWAANSELKRF